MLTNKQIKYLNTKEGREEFNRVAENSGLLSPRNGEISRQLLFETRKSFLTMHMNLRRWMKFYRLMGFDKK